MDLTNPFTAVVPSLDGPVLRVLNATERPLSGREIHRLANTRSAAGVRKVLQRLVDQSVVTVTESGPSLLYRANTLHVAWPAVSALMNMRAEFITRLTRYIDTWPVEPVFVGLFGSAARGDGSPDSDVDLLVVRPDHVAVDEDPADQVGVQWIEQVAGLRHATWATTGNHAHVLEFAASPFAILLGSEEDIVDEWRHDLVHLGGRFPRPLATAVLPSNTAVVKTAISIPDDTFDEADRYARTLGLNRSQFVTRALQRYLHELKSADLTARLDAALATEDSGNGLDDEARAILADNRRRLVDDGEDW